MSRAGLAISAVALAGCFWGCFSEPPYDPAHRVSFTEAGDGGGVATGPDFELRFAGGDRFHFPDSLKIDGTEVMVRDEGQSCYEEDGVGFLLWPAPRVSASGDAPRVTNLLEPVMTGPAVVQVKLDWATRLACATTRAPSGTSTFTVFPEGRIVRYDRLTDPSAESVGAGQCECAPSNGLFTVATFWTLANAPFRELYRGDNPDTAQPIPQAGDGFSNTDLQCLVAEKYQVGFAWSKPSTAVRGADKLVSFGFEFRALASMLPSFDYENSSALLIERAGCTRMFVRGDLHIIPPMISINGISTGPSPVDGIYGGNGGFELQGDEATITGGVDAAYAVWLRFPGSTDAVRAERMGASGPWYLPQRVDDRSWIIWFRDPLQLGQTIKISAR